MKGKEYKTVKNKVTVCEPASSQRNFWEYKNWGTGFVIQKDFSKSPSKISGLLTPKFPSGLRSSLRFVGLPVSANVPWDGWAVQVANQRPQGLFAAIWVIVTVGLLIVAVWLFLVALKLPTIAARVLR